jgi:hypothetical protein
VCRDDLFDLTRRVFAAAGRDVLGDPVRPLVVGVNGTLESGKKIITDAAVESLFEDGTAVMEGRAGRDEYWTGLHNGRLMEIDYIDAAWPGHDEYSPRIEKNARFTRRHGVAHDSKLSVFMKQREEGGITFLQNAHEEIPEPGLSFFIERTRGTIMNYTEPRKLDTPLALRDAFQTMGAKNPWARFVEINVRDERLLQDSRFMDAFIAFAPFCRLETPASPGLPVARAARTQVNIYGPSFPHPL